MSFVQGFLTVYDAGVIALVLVAAAGMSRRRSPSPLAAALLGLAAAQALAGGARLAAGALPLAGWVWLGQSALHLLVGYALWQVAQMLEVCAPQVVPAEELPELTHIRAVASWPGRRR